MRYSYCILYVGTGYLDTHCRSLGDTDLSQATQHCSCIIHSMNEYLHLDLWPHARAYTTKPRNQKSFPLRVERVKFQAIGRRLFIERYEIGYRLSRMKKWFHRWIRCSRLVASENHYASSRVARRCNNAGTGIRTARSHHKSIMAISVAIKSLQL